MSDSTLDIPTRDDVMKIVERDMRRDLCTNACEGITDDQIRFVIAFGGFAKAFGELDRLIETLSAEKKVVAP
jgi:hypothetical protein